MAVVNTKSSAITNADATPPTLNAAGLTRGQIYVGLGTVEVAASDDDGSTFRMVRVPSNAIILSLVRYNDAITSGTVYDLGLYDIAANGGAVVPTTGQEAFGSDIDLSSASTVGVEQRFEAANIDGIQKRVWEILGLSSDPNKDYDIVFTGSTVGSGAGTISLRVEYTI